MKVVITADFHLGLSGRTDDIMFSLRAIREYMHERDIENCIIAGDLFNDRTAIVLDVLSLSHKFFYETKHEYKQEWAVLPGNHDLFFKNSWEHNALKVFKDLITVIDDITIIKLGKQRFGIIPFVYYEDVYMRVLDNLVSNKLGGDDVIITHVGVNNATLNECFLIKNWNIVEFTDVPHKVYTGHFHCHQQVGDNLWYPGSPIPFTHAEGNTDHGFIVYDTETRTHEFVKTFECLSEPEIFGDIGKPPDFFTIIDSDIGSLKDADIVGNNVRIALGHEYSHNDLVDLRQTLIERGANKVSWLKPKDTADYKDDIVQVSMGDPGTLLSAWIDHDKPKHLDRDTLIRLGKEVIDEGNEHFVRSELDD